jgi:hypothetical protein
MLKAPSSLSSKISIHLASLYFAAPIRSLEDRESFLSHKLYSRVLAAAAAAAAALPRV